MTTDVKFTHSTRAIAWPLMAVVALALITFDPVRSLAQRQESPIEALVAPIALYPDPLLAQLLPAASYPDQVAAAAAYVAKNGTNGIDQQGWDASVAAVARYGEALQLMGNDPQWTYDLGTAFL